MWKVVVLATTCWLCPGDNFRHELKNTYPTKAECVANGELVLRLASLPAEYHPRVRCEEVDVNRR